MANLRALNAVAMFKAFLWSMTFFFLPVMLVNLGLGGLEMGILFSALTATAILVTFPIGVINDRLGTKGMIMASMLMLAAYYFGLSSAGSFWLLLPVFILGGAAATIFDSSAIGMVYKRLEIFRRGRRLGTYQLFVEVGAGAGLVVGGFLLFSGGFGAVLLGTAAAFLAILVLSAKLPRTARAEFPLVRYKKLLLRKDVLLLLVPLVLFATHWGVESTCYSLFLRGSMGLDAIASGLFMGLPIIALGVFAFFSGVSIDRKKKNGRLFIIGLLLSAVGHLLLFMQPVYLSFAFRVIHEIGDGIVAVSYTVAFSKMFPKKTIAGNSSLMGIIMALGSIAGSMIFGPLGQAFGYSLPFIVSGVIGLVSVASLVIVRGRTGF